MPGDVITAVTATSRRNKCCRHEGLLLLPLLPLPRFVIVIPALT
jgi:hypothetical protein